MDAAAKKWIQQYKKLFDQVAARNAGMNVVEDVTTVERKEQIKKIGKLVDELGGTATQVPEKVIKKIGKLVPDENAESDKKTASGTKVQDSGERFAVESDSKTKITAEMTDSERAGVLRNRTLTVPVYQGQADSVIEDVKRNYENEKKRFGKKAVVEIAEKLGIIGESINFDDVDVQIELSKSNLKESVVKEADPTQVAKLLPILSQTAEKSVVVERHKNRYYYDNDTEYVDNLIGAYIDGKDLVPVRFGLKHSRTGKTTLYVLIDQNKISLDKLGKIKNDRGLQDASSDLTKSNSLPRSVDYSISQILSLVNTKDLLRYIPDDFLNSEQIKGKRKAIAETQEYTNKKNDEKYARYIEEGKKSAAKQMLSAKAKDKGYTGDSDYQGSLAFNGAAPSSNAYYSTKEERIEAFERGDFEGDYSFGDFIDNGLDGHDLEWQLKNPIAASGRDSATLASLRNLNSVIRQGKRKIKMYRAVDSKIKENRFRNGDWITPSREYAERHIELQVWESGRIIEQEVSIDDIWWNGDDINEWGYDNGDTNEVYKNTPNNVKTTEITYDDEGKLIPLSRRYDESNPDSRYALADGKRATAGEVAAVKSSISKKGIDPKGIIAIADKYFARYSGQLTRTGVRYEFLAAADMLFDLTAESGDRAYASVEALAEELVTNEKDTSGMTEDIKEMKRHIR